MEVCCVVLTFSGSLDYLDSYLLKEILLIVDIQSSNTIVVQCQFCGFSVGFYGFNIVRLLTVFAVLRCSTLLDN